MNKRQKIVQEAFLNNEEAVIRRLKQVYNQSLKDITNKAQELQSQITALNALEGAMSDPEALAKIQSMKQAKVYQKQYQDALKKQVNSILDNMQVEEFKTVSEYLNKCYEEGFLGTMYDLQGQGIPLCFPLDQEAMVRAVQLDSKISNGLYERLGEDVSLLKRKITAQVSRGISTGMSFQQVAKGLSDYTNIGFNNAVRIARTEGHRIQVQSGMDACYKAKEKGADVVKQWDASLDGRTRPSHRKVDGEIRELDEPFSNGLMFAGDPDGGASEVVNCRCALLQRARWALDDEFSKYDNFSGELKKFENDEAYKGFKKDYFSDENVQYMKYTKELEKKYKTKDFNKILEKMTDVEYKHFKKLEKERPTFEGMYKGQNVIRIKTSDYDEFKKKYLKAAEESSKMNVDNILNEPIKSSDPYYKKLLDSLASMDKVDYIPVHNHTKVLTDEEIIKALAGGDKTKGSCASVGLAYIGQKQGWNVLDFRDGASRMFFSRGGNLHTLSLAEGLKVHRAKGASSMTVGNRLLKQCEAGKEYYLCVGRHASIVRKTEEGVLQYLELQSATRSGWTNFNENPRYTLKNRFGCTQTSGASEIYDYMIDLDGSNFDTDEFKSLLGYINTLEDKQMKGVTGSVK